MAQRSLRTGRPASVYLVVVPVWSHYLGASIERVYGPYSESGAKSAHATEYRYNKGARILRAETRWGEVAA